MNNLKIFLTFDHELPLGGLNVSYRKALFDPTLKVLDLARELQVPVTFFTDVLCALRFKKWDNEGFYQPYIEQLKFATTQMHDVQLHLHPHWLTSDYKKGAFIPSNDFMLSDFSARKYPDDIAGIVERGCAFLNHICRETNPGYKCIAYRAGGYNLAPGSNVIFSELYKNGIRFDSSICKGYYFKSAISEVDYTKVPTSPNWFIGNDGNYQNISDSGILEIPIAGKPKGLLEMPTRFKMKKYRYRAPENMGKQIHEGKPPALIDKVKQALSSRMLCFDNYTYSPGFLMKILNDHVRKHSGSETIMLSAIGHPKSMSDYSLFLMKSFVEDVRRKYKENVQFYTFSQLLDELGD